MKKLFKKQEVNIDYFTRHNVSSRYNEDNDRDLDILDELINRNSKKKDKKKKGKKSKKKDKDKDKKNKNSNKKKKKLLDLSQVYNDVEGPGISKNKKARSSEDFYETRFNGSLVLLRELLKQVNGQIVDGETTLGDMRTLSGNKVRGSLTALTAQTANVNSLLGTKLNIIKEITSVNKSISDLEFKQAKELSENSVDEAKNDDRIINEIYKKIVNDEFGDTKNTKKKKKKPNNDKKKKSDDLDDEYDDIASIDDVDFDDDDDIRALVDYEYDNEGIDDELDNMIDELVDNGELEFSQTEQAFKYEGKVRVCVLKNPKTERWRFIALDKKNDEIYDYPLPTKRACGRMTFDRETGIAKDSLSNSYEIFFSDTTIEDEI